MPVRARRRPRHGHGRQPNEPASMPNRALSWMPRQQLRLAPRGTCLGRQRTARPRGFGRPVSSLPTRRGDVASPTNSMSTPACTPSRRTGRSRRRATKRPGHRESDTQDYQTGQDAHVRQSQGLPAQPVRPSGRAGSSSLLNLSPSTRRRLAPRGARPRSRRSWLAARSRGSPLAT